MIGFYITGHLGASRTKEPLIDEKTKSTTEEFGGWRGIVRLTIELLKAPDFQRIVLVNFCKFKL
jgi:hypothetical protein